MEQIYRIKKIHKDDAYYKHSTKLIGQLGTLRLYRTHSDGFHAADFCQLEINKEMFKITRPYFYKVLTERVRVTCTECVNYSYKLHGCSKGWVNPRTLKETISVMEHVSTNRVCRWCHWREKALESFNK